MNELMEKIKKVEKDLQKNFPDLATEIRFYDEEYYIIINNENVYFSKEFAAWRHKIKAEIIWKENIPLGFSFDPNIRRARENAYITINKDKTPNFFQDIKTYSRILISNKVVTYNNRNILKPINKPTIDLNCDFFISKAIITHKNFSTATHTQNYRASNLMKVSEQEKMAA